MQFIIPSKSTNAFARFGIGLGLAAIACLGTATIQGQTQIGIGSDQFAEDVDSAGDRMNIENFDDTFPTLAAGTYDVADFEYSTSAEVADIQPFLAVSTGDDEYRVIWVGPTEESPGTDDIVTTSYDAGSQKFTLEDSQEVYAGFNARGPVVKFGAGLTDHSNPSDFDIALGSEILSFSNPNLPRSYAFEINVQSSSSDIEGFALEAAVSFPTSADAVVLSSATVGTSVGSLRGINEFGNPVGGLEISLAAGAGDTNNGLYSIGGPKDDQLLVKGSLAGLNDVVHSVRVLLEGDNGSFEGAVTFTVKLDSDNDSLIDAWETMFGSLGDFASGSDHDGDSVDDAVEFELGINPNKSDTDGDGFNDGVEVAANSDPADADSLPVFDVRIGIGSDHPGADVDGAGSRMNVENFSDTFPQLSAGTYDVADFRYSTSAEVADIQPFLAVSTADDEYQVIWVGPTEESPGTDDIVTTAYEPGSHQFTLDDPAEVYAGFNAAGPIVKFGGGLTDHANPANFEIEFESEISGFGHANLARSYAFEINVRPSASDVENIGIKAAINFPTDADAAVLSSAPISTAVGALVGLSEFGSPLKDVDFSLVSGEGDTNNGMYTIGGPNGDQLLVNTSLAGLNDIVHSVRVLAEGNSSVEKAITFTIKLDSDADGLIDAWETTFGVLGDFATGADHDADGLNDDVEFGLKFNPNNPDADNDGSLDGAEIANGTDPAKPDTDGDGLNDGAEATAKSNPLVSDTDGDGISDGAEVSSANGFVTDPTLRDTDGDGFDDDIELAANSDPTNAGSQPSFEGLVTIGVGTDLPADGGVDSAGTRMNIENSDESFPTLPPGTYNVRDFTYVAGADTEDLQPFLATNVSGDEYIVIWVGPSEPASGSDDVTTVPYEIGSQQFTLTAATEVYAGFNAAGPSVKFGNGGLTDHNNPAVFEIDVDTEIAAWTNANLGRSYRFGINVESAVTVDFEITKVVYSGGVSPSVTLTFNSTPGATYALFTSTTLLPDGEPGGWIEVTDGIDSEGTETTYTDTDGVEFATEVYYRFGETR